MSADSGSPGIVMTRDEVARALRITPRTLSDKIKSGVLPLQPVTWSGYRMLFLRADVDRITTGQRRGTRRIA